MKLQTTFVHPPFGKAGLAALLALATAAGLWLMSAQGGLSGRDRDGAAAARAQSAAATEHQAFTGLFAGRTEREVEVARGESLAMLLSRAGAPWRDIDDAMDALALVFDTRRVRPGQDVSVYLAQTNGATRLTGFAFRSDPGAAVTVNRLIEGEFAAREILTPLTFEVAHVVGVVDGSLYQAAVSAGATDRELAAMSDVFAYDVDFQRDIFPGDTFELVFERFFDEEGRTVKTGELMFVGLNAREGPKVFYRFKLPGDAEADWYDSNGRTARKFLMKTPINGARLTSGFGMRRHPILGFSRMHQGIDFAAPTGTPIMAAGDGTVVRAGFMGAFGRYIRIKHSGDYETAYAHLSAFSKGLKQGAKVRQGQIIGYVGTSGLSTGPHLHYEVMVKGRQINPISLKVPTGRILTGPQLQQFMAERARIDALRRPKSDQPALPTIGPKPPLVNAAFREGPAAMQKKATQ
jgi:murein DD-endopeptidase MepM/ murein hydrolase activator NlpD